MKAFRARLRTYTVMSVNRENLPVRLGGMGRLSAAVRPAHSLRGSNRWSPGLSPCRLGRLPILAVMLGLIASSGCVRRTVTINTEPQGATVILNDEIIGTSPVSRDFMWYGDYDVIIRKAGFETLKTHHRLDTPWYQLPGIDFVSEVLVPFEIHDQREMAFALEPEQPVDREQLVRDARALREEALFGSEESAASRPSQ